MNVKVKQKFKISNKEMRTTYNDTLVDLAKTDDKIVLLEADLMRAIKTNDFQKKYPNRTLNIGIMEQNMMGVAAGLSVRGLKPYIHTFGPFATRRSFDQLFLSLGYADLNAIIIGSDAGISASHNGGTHMPFEDLGLVRLVPNMTVMEMTDPVMFENILRQLNDQKQLSYLRIVRKHMLSIYQEGSTFEIGKGIVLREGKDATIVAAGIMVANALKAQALLQEDGINVSVIDMFTIKPIDQALLLEYADKTQCIVTAENHNIIGGLGSAVLEALETTPVTVKRVGVKDRFGQVGTQAFLEKEYELTAEDIVKAVKEQL
ncbi:MAG: transketolase family protein [Candidatus Izimaplasma sp.]|nr:transketolase family protein [Candidatus Izimaplasma bacterium]